MKLKATDPTAARVALTGTLYCFDRATANSVMTRPPCRREKSFTFRALSATNFVEDAEIMAMVETLEAHWTYNLTDDQRDLWRAYWQTDLPDDIFGRYYQTTPPEKPNHFEVTEPRMYAWTQCYATYRLGYPPLDSPGSPQITNPESASLSLSDGRLMLSLELGFLHRLPSDVLVYATPPALTPPRDIPWRLRYCGYYTQGQKIAETDITDIVTARYPLTTGRYTTVRAAIVGQSNQLLTAPVSTVLIE